MGYRCVVGCETVGAGKVFGGFSQISARAVHFIDSHLMKQMRVFTNSFLGG